MIDVNVRTAAEAGVLPAGVGVLGDLLIVPFMNKQLSREGTVVRLVLNTSMRTASHPGHSDGIFLCSWSSPGSSRDCLVLKG